MRNFKEEGWNPPKPAQETESPPPTPAQNPLTREEMGYLGNEDRWRNSANEGPGAQQPAPQFGVNQKPTAPDGLPLSSSYSNSLRGTPKEMMEERLSQQTDPTYHLGNEALRPSSPINLSGDPVPKSTNETWQPYGNTPTTERPNGPVSMTGEPEAEFVSGEPYMPYDAEPRRGAGGIVDVTAEQNAKMAAMDREKAEAAALAKARAETLAAYDLTPPPGYQADTPSQ